MAGQSHKMDNHDPFSDDANWAEGTVSSPLLTTERASRPTTPRRATSTRSINSPNSQSKSGIVFGSPRRQRRGSNPFSDLQTGQQTSPEREVLAASLRSFAYPRRVPDETAYSLLHDAHATPGNDQEDLDEKHDLEAAVYRDDEDDALPEKSEKDYLRSKPVSAFMSLFSRFRRKPWTAPEAVPVRPVFTRFWRLVVLVLVAVVVVATIFVLSVLNTKSLSVHWKGTLSDSVGAIDSTGFNFTRHLDLGFTNPNLFPTTVSGVTVWAAYQDTHFFGLTENNHVGLDIDGMNKRNLTLPVAMDFAYISNQDPDNYMLETMLTECGQTGVINFELIVHAEVKALRFIGYTAKFERIEASMSCDNNMSVLMQEMYVKLKGSS